MLRTIAGALLIGLVSTVALAQRPSPSPPPPPARGTRASTEAAVEQFNAAVAKYEAMSADPKSDLGALDKALAEADAAGTELRVALYAQTNASSEVQAAKEALDKAREDYEDAEARKKDYETVKRADDRFTKAAKVYNRISDATYDQIKKTVAGDVSLTVTATRRHMQLLIEKMKADAAAKKKAEAEKKAQPSPEPKKTGCAPQRGLGGAIENIACQDQHSGGGH